MGVPILYRGSARFLVNLKIVGTGGGMFFNPFHIILQRVSADIDSKDFLLKFQKLLLTVFIDLRHGKLIFLPIFLYGKIKQGHLPRNGFLLLLRNLIKNLYITHHQLPAVWMKIAERTGLDKAFHRPLINLFPGQAGCKIF